MGTYNAVWIIIGLCAFIVLVVLLAFGNCLYQMGKTEKENQRRTKEQLAKDGSE